MKRWKAQGRSLEESRFVCRASREDPIGGESPNDAVRSIRDEHTALHSCPQVDEFRNVGRGESVEVQVQGLLVERHGVFDGASDPEKAHEDVTPLVFIFSIRRQL